MRIKVHRHNQSITIISAPVVTMISRPEFHSENFRSWLDQLGIKDQTEVPGVSHGARNCEVAGRTCYLSFDKPRPGGIAAYVGNILSSGHGSVLEHSNITMAISGVSRSLTHEFVRHRAGWGYSQLSQRYVDAKRLAFVVPPRLTKGIFSSLSFGITAISMQDPPEFQVDAGNKTLVENWGRNATKEETEIGYLWLQQRFANVAEYNATADMITAELSGPDFDNMEKTEKRKIGFQTARNCLPNCTETMMIATANVRALRHFISMRGSKHADEEIRYLTHGILSVCKGTIPELFDDVIVDNSCSPQGVGLKHPKV